jgi:hypothetical protein
MAEGDAWVVARRPPHFVLLGPGPAVAERCAGSFRSPGHPAHRLTAGGGVWLRTATGDRGERGRRWPSGTPPRPRAGWGAGRERRVQYVPRERATARIIGGAGRPDESASPASAGPLQAAGKYHPPGSLARGAEPTGGAPVSVPSVRSVASCSVFMK